MKFVNRFFDKRRGDNPIHRDQYSLAELNDIMNKLKSLESTSDLPKQIQLLRQALLILDKGDFQSIVAFPALWGNLQLTLANNLSKLSTTTDPYRKMGYSEEAVQHYLMALDVFTPTSNPEEWASTLNNLGNVYELVVNIEKIVQDFETDLFSTNRITAPNDWAMLHMHLGILHSKMHQSEKALYDFDQALEIYTQPGYSIERAFCSLELASIYLQRTAGDLAENIDEAISHYHQSLQVFLPVPYPLQWTIIQRGLGIAYQQRIGGNRGDNLQQSIQCYRNALEGTNRETQSEQWGNLHFLIASAYQEVNENRLDNFDHTITHLNLALEVIDRNRHPMQWAQIQFGLGTAYMDWRLEPKFWDIEKSINYLQSLYKDSPIQKNSFLDALAHAYIGKAYTMRPQGIRADNLKQARYHLDQGMKFFSPERYPNEFRFWGKALLDVFLRTKEWGMANALADRVLESDRLLYSLALSEPSKWRVFQSVSGDLHSSVGYIKARMQKLDKAVEIIESGLSQVFKSGFGASVPYRDLQTTIEAKEISDSLGNVPLVYLIHTSGGGAAIIIQADQITPVWLDSVSTEALHAFLSEKIGSVSYFQAHQSLTIDAGITNGQTEWLEVLDKTCQWLWDNVMEKVIPTLEMSCSRGSKIMIVPCGLFSLLPIHAAWIADTSMPAGRRFAQDHFKFGYAPSAVLLLNRKKMVNVPHSESLLVVENPAGDLKYSNEAARTAMSFFDETLHLSGQSADRSTIKSNFHKYSTMYFFTHSAVHPERPFESGILLASNQWLTLKDIYSEAPIRNTRLVILAACETGLPADRSLLEQTVSLPSVLLRVGIPGIVGTLWPVPEASTAVLLTIFFELWRTMGYSPQAALVEAQRILRDARFVPADRNHFNSDQSAPRIKPLPAESVKLFNQLLKLGDFHHPYYWAGFTYHGF